MQASTARTSFLAGGLCEVLVNCKKERPEPGGVRQIVIHGRVLHRVTSTEYTPREPRSSDQALRGEFSCQPRRTCSEITNFTSITLATHSRTIKQIAVQLNAEGYHTPRSRKGYTSTSVRKLLSRGELTRGRIGTRQLDRHEWWLPDLARALQMPVDKLRIWAIRGWVRSWQVTPRGLWVVWADGRERRRLWKLMADSRSSKSAEQTSS